MNKKNIIMNPTALGWLIAIGLVSVIVGIAVGLSSGTKAGLITALIIFALFGGIEGAIIFLSDQSLLNSKGRDHN